MDADKKNNFLFLRADHLLSFLFFCSSAGYPGTGSCQITITMERRTTAAAEATTSSPTTKVTTSSSTRLTTITTKAEEILTSCPTSSFERAEVAEVGAAATGAAQTHFSRFPASSRPCSP